MVSSLPLRIGTLLLVVGSMFAVSMTLVHCGSSSENDEALISSILGEMQLPTVASQKVWRSAELFDTRAIGQERTDEAGQLWQRFRSAYPFGIQGIAVSKTDAEGKCSVVIAEPPPHVAFNQLQAIVDGATIQKQSFGHDGALLDVVGTLSGGEAAIASKLSQLNLLLFRTDYRGYVFQEPFTSNPTNGRAFHLDVEPTPAELHQWLSDDGARYKPVDGGPALTLDEVQTEPWSNVYELLGKGVIVWRIPEGLSVSRALVEARMFALASDLIIGAVKDKGLMLCARSRVAPVSVLPPLRVETIALLAAVKDQGQLEQSYQRMNPGAGAYSSRYDWAPVLLSPELVDTEYGHLLNVADQLLKGWSQAGRVTYKGFSAYREPDDYPFGGATPLSKIVHDRFHQNSVTFNWNTTGAGYAITLNGTQVYTPYRTGALPISYIPGEDPTSAPDVANLEDEAYQWYNRQNDTTLSRVVQYAAIYQIFHNLGVTASDDPAPKSDRPFIAYTDAMEGFWSKVDKYSPSDVSRLADESPYRGRLSRAQSRHSADIDTLLATPADLLAIQTEALRDGIEAWRGLSEQDKDEVRVETSLLDGHVTSPDLAEALDKASSFLAAVATETKLADRFASSVPISGRSWIHTTTVVMSDPTPMGQVFVVGGHNVRAQITELLPNENVPAGEVRIEDGKVVINGADASRARSLVREAAQRMGHEDPELLASELTQKLKLVENRPLREPRVALAFDGAVPQNSEFPVSRGMSLIADRIAVPAEISAVLNPSAIEPGHISICQRDGLFWIGGPPPQGPVVTSSAAEAGEVLALRTQASGGGRRFRGTSGGGGGNMEPPPGSMGGGTGEDPPEFDFYGVGDESRRSIMDEVGERLKNHEFSPEVVAVALDDPFARRPPRLSNQDYDFASHRIESTDIESADGQLLTKVSVKLTPRDPAAGEASLHFELRSKDGARESLRTFRDAVVRKIKDFFSRYANSAGHPDPAAILHAEIRRASKAHNIDVRTEVMKKSGTWRLTQRDVPGGARAA
jgi:hypothetical protein